MKEKRLLILDKHQIEQKLDRIAYQLLEDNYDEQEIIIAGILPRGDHLALRLKNILDKIAPFKSILMTIEIDKQSTSLRAKTDADISICHNKAVILVDDVLNSGKTLAYGFGVFLDVPLKKLRTVVLIARHPNNVPVTTD